MPPQGDKHCYPETYRQSSQERGWAMNDDYLHDVLREAEAAFETTCETKAEAIGRRSFLKLTGVAGGGAGTCLLP